MWNKKSLYFSNFCFCLLGSVFLNAQNNEFKTAKTLFEQSNYSKAISIYNSLDNNPETFYYMAESYYSLGFENKAIDYYQKAIDHFPDRLAYKLRLGDLLERNDRFEEMKVIFKDLIQQDSLNANFNFKYGVALSHLNDTLAKQAFLNAIKIDPKHLKSIKELASIELSANRLDSALAYSNKGLALNENDKVLLNYKGSILHTRKDYHESVKYFEKLIQLNEKKPFIYKKIRDGYAYNLNFNKAIPIARTLIELEPNDPTHYYKLGKIYNSEKAYDSAEVYINKAITLLDVPLDNEYTTLGVIYNQQKNHSKAIHAFQNAIKENPNNDLLYFYLANTKAAYYKDTESKINAFREVLNKFPETTLKPLITTMIEKLKKEEFIEGSEAN